MSKRYDQYCPMAHALGLVGERWALLDRPRAAPRAAALHRPAANLPGIGTNILASRLKELEACGIVAKRRLPPPAASQVYELTPYGHALKPVIRELAIWGIRSLGPPTLDNAPATHWLEDALDTSSRPWRREGSFEFRVGGEVASLVDGKARAGPLENADVVVARPTRRRSTTCSSSAAGTGVEVEGDRELLERLLDAAAAPAASVPTAA